MKTVLINRDCSDGRKNRVNGRKRMRDVDIFRRLLNETENRHPMYRSEPTFASQEDEDYEEEFYASDLEDADYWDNY